MKKLPRISRPPPQAKPGDTSYPPSSTSQTKTTGIDTTATTISNTSHEETPIAVKSKDNSPQAILSNTSSSFKGTESLVAAPNKTFEPPSPTNNNKLLDTPTTTISIGKSHEPVAITGRTSESITVTSSQATKTPEYTTAQPSGFSLPNTAEKSHTTQSTVAPTPVRTGEFSPTTTPNISSSPLKGNETIAQPNSIAIDKAHESPITKPQSFSTEIKHTDQNKGFSTPSIYDNSNQIKATDNILTNGGNSKLTVNVATQTDKIDTRSNTVKSAETTTTNTHPVETTITTGTINMANRRHSTQETGAPPLTPSQSFATVHSIVKSESTAPTHRQSTNKTHLPQDETTSKAEPKSTHHHTVNNFVPFTREREEKPPQTPSEEIVIQTPPNFGQFTGGSGNTTNNNNQDPSNQTNTAQASTPVTVDIPLPNLIIVGDDNSNKASKRQDLTNTDGKIATSATNTTSGGGWPLSPVKGTDKTSGKKEQSPKEDELSIAIKAFLDKTQKQVNQTQANRYDPEKTSKYKIAEGETLASIAESLFGDPKLAALIYQINSGLWKSSKRSGKIQLVFSPGITIFLPTRKEIAEYRKSAKNKNTQFEYFTPQSPSSLRGILSARRSQENQKAKIEDCATVVVTAPPHKSATERLATLKHISSISRNFNSTKDFKDLEANSRFTEDELDGNYRAKIECLLEGEWKVVVEYIVGSKAYINSYTLAGKVREIHLDLPQEIVKPMAINDLEKNRLTYCKKYLQGLKLFC